MRVNYKYLKQSPTKSTARTQYHCGLVVTGGWNTQLKKHQEFCETPMGKYILKLESNQQHLKR